MAFPLSIYGIVHVAARGRFLAACSGRIQAQKTLLAELAAQSEDVFCVIIAF